MRGTIRAFVGADKGSVRPEMKTAVVVVYFLALAWFAGLGPTGFDDKLHYGLLPFCVVGCFVVVSRRWPKLNVHILWAAFYAVSLTQMYRLYAYEKWSAEAYHHQLIREAQPSPLKTGPNQSSDPTLSSGTPPAGQEPRHP